MITTSLLLTYYGRTCQVGRDPAGMPYSSGPNDGDDIYHPDHGTHICPLTLTPNPDPNPKPNLALTQSLSGPLRADHLS